MSSARDAWCLADATNISRLGCRLVLCIEGRSAVRLEADTEELCELWEMALRRGCIYAKYKNNQLFCMNSKPEAVSSPVEGQSSIQTYETISIDSFIESTNNQKDCADADEACFILESVFRDS